MIAITADEEERYAELQNMALDFARKGNLDELSRMIYSGLNINLSDHKGNSLLMLASYNNQIELVEFLIKKGAEVDKRNDRGQTPLAGVCFKGYFEMVKLLVEKGKANIYANNGMGTTPVTFSALFGHKEITEYLTKDKKSTVYSMLTNTISYIRRVF